jgi:5'-3' exonuclease
MVWVLIDLSWLAYRALYAVRGLEHEDLPTGVIFGFFSQLKEVCSSPLVRSNRVAIFCDSRESIRAQQYPAYKQTRREERTPEEAEQVSIMRYQVNALRRELLPSIGLVPHEQVGLESDDLMAWAARRISANASLQGIPHRKRAVMITGDADLYQGITPSVHWYNPQREAYYNAARFEQEKGVPPKAWVTVKAIGGCRSDNVAGVAGVGEATALRFLLRQLPPHHKTYQRIVSAEGQSIVARNLPLVTLPHKQTQPIRLHTPEYNPAAFFAMCERYGMQSMIHNRTQWEAFFRGSHFRTRRRGDAQVGG